MYNYHVGQGAHSYMPHYQTPIFKKMGVGFSTLTCEGVGSQPQYTPTPPFAPQTPTKEQLAACIGHWTYFWSNIGGTGWMYVTGVGIHNGRDIVIGCVEYCPSSNPHSCRKETRFLYRKDITNIIVDQ